MVVSEPPKAEKRWPTAELSLLGLETREVEKPNYGTFQILELTHIPDQIYPRSPKTINKKALLRTGFHGNVAFNKNVSRETPC